MSLRNCQVQRLSVVKGEHVNSQKPCGVPKDHLTMRSPQTHILSGGLTCRSYALDYHLQS